MDKVLLIDGLNFIYRSNIKFGSINKEYKHTTIYNFFRSLRALIDKFEPKKVFFCLESKSNFRYALYSKYKANRKIIKLSSTIATKDTDNSFDEQRDKIIELLQNLPITTVYADGYEADDVIGELSNNLKDEEIIIVSNDTDYIQLLQKGYSNLKIFNPIKKDFVETPKYYYLVYKILAGDKTDNIPGLVSVSKAEDLAGNPKLLSLYLNNKENIANFNLNKELIQFATIPENKLIFNIGSCKLSVLKKEFKKMEFDSMLKESYWSKFEKTFNNLL